MFFHETPTITIKLSLSLWITNLLLKTESDLIYNNTSGTPTSASQRESTGSFSDSPTAFYRRLVLAEWPTNKSNTTNAARAEKYSHGVQYSKRSSVANTPFLSSKPRPIHLLVRRLTPCRGNAAGRRRTGHLGNDRDDLTGSGYGASDFCVWHRSAFMSGLSVLVLITAPKPSPVLVLSGTTEQVIKRRRPQVKADVISADRFWHSYALERQFWDQKKKDKETKLTCYNLKNPFHYNLSWNGF